MYIHVHYLQECICMTSYLTAARSNIKPTHKHTAMTSDTLWLQHKCRIHQRERGTGGEWRNKFLSLVGRCCRRSLGTFHDELLHTHERMATNVLVWINGQLAVASFGYSCSNNPSLEVSIWVGAKWARAAHGWSFTVTCLHPELWPLLVFTLCHSRSTARWEPLYDTEAMSSVGEELAKVREKITKIPNTELITCHPSLVQIRLRYTFTIVSSQIAHVESVPMFILHDDSFIACEEQHKAEAAYMFIHVQCTCILSTDKRTIDRWISVVSFQKTIPLNHW